MTLIICAALVYAVLFVAGNGPQRTNPWNITVADRLLWFPAEAAFIAFGWVVMNPGLVGAAMIPIAPFALFLLWLAYAS